MRCIISRLTGGAIHQVVQYQAEIGAILQQSALWKVSVLRQAKWSVFPDSIRDRCLSAQGCKVGQLGIQIRSRRCERFDASDPPSLVQDGFRNTVSSYGDVMLMTGSPR